MASVKSSISVEEQVQSFRRGDRVGFCLAESRSLVSVTGADATPFLQNRTTNDVAGLKVGGGHWNAVLDKGAHVQGFFWLGKSEVDTQWLAIEKGIATQTLQELTRYRILEDVQFTPRSDDACFGMYGLNARHVLEKQLDLSLESLGLLGCQLVHWRNTRGVLVCQNILGEEGFWLWLPRETMPSWVDSLEMLGTEVMELSQEAFNVLCMEAGTLASGIDFDSTTLLPETGLEQWAVSYNKGCYLGQETVARVKTYGSLQKALVGLRWLSSEQDEKQSLTSGALVLEASPDTEVGKLTRAQWSPTLNAMIGYAYLGKAYRVPETTLLLRFLPDNQGPPRPLNAVVKALPFYQADPVERAKSFLTQGLHAYANGSDSEAVRCLKRAVAQDSQSADAMEALGGILSRQGLYEDALEWMHRLVALEPTRVMAYTNMSVCYMQLGDKEKAEDAKAKATMVGFQAAMDKKRSAQKEALTHSDRDPVPEGLVEISDEQRAALREKVALFESALLHSPMDALGNFGLGCALLDLGEYQRAVAALSHTVGLPASQSVAYTKLGQAYAALGNNEEARNVYMAGVEVASRRRDMMALNELQARLAASGSSDSG